MPTPERLPQSIWRPRGTEIVAAPLHRVLLPISTWPRPVRGFFMLEMENKLPDVLAEFKKGNLPDDGVKKMVELANGIIPQYK